MSRTWAQDVHVGLRAGLVVVQIGQVVVVGTALVDCEGLVVGDWDNGAGAGTGACLCCFVRLSLVTSCFTDSD